MLYSLIEKAFTVFLVLSNLDKTYAGGFYVSAEMDSIIIAWSPRGSIPPI